MQQTQTEVLAQPAQMNTPTTQRQTTFRWVVVALAFFITIVNYMDRTAIAYAIGPMKKQFHLTDGDFGIVFAVFGVGYMFSTFIGGMLVDRFGAHRLWSGAAIAWSSMTAALGIVSGFWPLLMFRTMLGITEGPSFPSLTRVTTDWLPMSERVRSTAFGLVAVPLASVIGAPLITTLIAAFGWQAMFFVLGSLGVIWAAVWWHFFRDYPENNKHVSRAELDYIRGGSPAHSDKTEAEIRKYRLESGKTSIASLLKNPALMSNNYAFFSFGYLLFFAINWLPEYLAHTFGLTLKQIGAYLPLPWACAALALATCGWLSDRLWRKTGSIRAARTHIIWVCQLLSALCFTPLMFTHSLEVAIFFLSLGLAFGLGPNACFYALNADLAGDRAATSLGLMTSCTGTAAVLAPFITGKLIDLTGSFNSAFGLMIFFTLTSVIAILVFQHPDRHRANCQEL